MPDVASDALVAEYIARLYSLTRESVRLWGGPIALASVVETSMSIVSERLNRREVKGALQRAFIDYLGIVLTHADAAQAFLFGLCDLLGYEHPKKRRTKTDPEKLHALVKALRGCGPLGEAAIARAAAELGADATEFEP